MKENIRNTLLFIFEQGLDEDAFYRAEFTSEQDKSIVNIESLKIEINKFRSNTLEYDLLNLLICDIETKKE